MFFVGLALSWACRRFVSAIVAFSEEAEGLFLALLCCRSAVRLF